MSPSLIFSTVNLGLGGLVFLLGLVILRENPHARLNRLVSMLLFFGGFGAVLAGLGFMADRPASRTGTDLLQSMAYVWELFFPTMFLFASTFPEERRFTRIPPLFGGRFWTPGFTFIVFTPHVFHFALMVLLTVGLPRLALPTDGPLQVFQPISQVVRVFGGLFLVFHQTLFSLVNLGFGIATIALLTDSYRKAQVPRLKRQLGVIATGLSASLVCYSLATSIPGLFNRELPAAWRSALTILALTIGSGSIAYSIVRYKFLDAKLLMRRGILYALGSAVLVGVYLLIVGHMNRYLVALTGTRAQVLEPVLLIIALALFQPAIARLEEIVDQMFLKDPSDYRNVLRHLGRELQTTIDLELLLARTIETVAETLILDRAHIVALPRRGIASHTGAGPPLEEADLAMLARALPRVSAQQTSYRLAERVDGLSREEQDVIAGRLGLALMVPLRWRGDLVGALLLGRKVLATDYTSEDVNLLTQLAQQVSVSLQNALLLRDRVAVARFEEELNLARQIQRASLLSEFPAMPRSEVHAIYIPSRQVGGDFYDVVETGDGGWLVAIADVSGKGVPAALLSSMLQASLRTQADGGRSVAAMLRSINTLLYRSTTVQQFATFFLARIDAASMRMTFSNAGHNWPVLLRRGGGREFLERGGTILGILEHVDFEEATVALAPGDRVVLYTDGISEATNEDNELFGEERIIECLENLPPEAGAREIAECLLERVRDFLDGTEPQDDITLLVLRVLEPAPAAPAGTPVREVVGAG
jgi:serine phosphatase RsbU (regulator of sigma subunit)